MSDRPLSVRSRARYRDYHGRGLRGPVLPRELPAFKTRSETFDNLLSRELAFYRRLYPEKLGRIDYGVLDVPEAEPAPWETSAPLSRFIPPSHSGGDGGRVVFYRRPILQAARGGNLADFIHTIVLEQITAIIE